MDTGYPIQLKNYFGEVWIRENRQLPRPENEEHSRSLKSRNKSFRKKQELSLVMRGFTVAVEQALIMDTNLKVKLLY